MDASEAGLSPASLRFSLVALAHRLDLVPDPLRSGAGPNQEIRRIWPDSGSLGTSYDLPLRTKRGQTR